MALPRASYLTPPRPWMGEVALMQIYDEDIGKQVRPIGIARRLSSVEIACIFLSTCLANFLPLDVVSPELQSVIIYLNFRFLIFWVKLSWLSNGSCLKNKYCCVVGRRRFVKGYNNEIQITYHLCLHVGGCDDG